MLEILHSMTVCYETVRERCAAPQSETASWEQSRAEQNRDGAREPETEMRAAKGVAKLCPPPKERIAAV